MLIQILIPGPFCGWKDVIIPCTLCSHHTDFFGPRGSKVKVSACNAGDQSSIPGSGRFPWRRKWQSTPVFSPGESYGQRSQRVRQNSDFTHRPPSCAVPAAGIPFFLFFLLLPPDAFRSQPVWHFLREALCESHILRASHTPPFSVRTV